MTTTENPKALPSSITLRGRNYQITGWRSNADLDGWTGEVAGLPDHRNSDDLEIEIWETNGVASDVYADGSALIHIRA